ncbi:MAG: surface-adhesin E family protein [Nitrosomonadaceae bacterium]
MHKAILIMLLVVVSSSAMADWVYVSEHTDNSGFSPSYAVYADPDTIRKLGNKLKVWDLSDNKTAEIFLGKKSMSTSSQKEYNCEEEKMRLLHETAYSKNMGRGEVIKTVNNITEWMPLAPYSIGNDLLKYACSADAEWDYVATRTKKRPGIIYADPTSIQRTGNRVKMWILFDSTTTKEIEGKRRMSTKFQLEFDCKKEQHRMLYGTAHSKKMGKGDIVYAMRETSEWRPIKNKRIGRAQLEIACEK